MLALVFLMLWVPVTSHCQLESLPGFEFLHCPGDSGTSGCCDDACVIVESGAYKVPDYQNFSPLVEVVPVVNFIVLLRMEESLEWVSCSCPAPLELPSGWQFSYRTALPVRAPSVAS